MRSPNQPAKFAGALEAFGRVGRWDKYEHYFAIYDRFLRPLQGRKLRMLEIGVDRGGSIAGWQEFFGRDLLTYFGLDTNPACQEFAREGVTIFTADQADRTSACEIARALPELNFVVDDGGHVASQQVTSFEAFFPKLVCGGIYMIEDTHTSFWPKYRSAISLRGETRNVGAIGYFCALTTDMMERWWDIRSRSAFNAPREGRVLIEVGEYARTIYAISFFDSLIVVEKGDVSEPLRLRRK